MINRHTERQNMSLGSVFLACCFMWLLIEGLALIPFLSTIVAIHRQKGNYREVKGQSTRDRARELQTFISCLYAPLSYYKSSD